MIPNRLFSHSADNSPLFLRTIPTALLGMCFLGAAPTVAQSAVVVSSFTGSIAFDAATPSPGSLSRANLEDYQGLVTGQSGGSPQLTVTTANDTTLNETAADWDNAGQGIAPIGSFTFRDQAGINTRPVAFDLFGVVPTMTPAITGTILDMTEFSISGLTFATRDRGNSGTGYAPSDDITVNILDSAGAVVATGDLVATGGGLNTASLGLGGVFNGAIDFSPISGHLPVDSYSVQLDMSDGGWGGETEGFWIDLNNAELTVNYTIPEPSRAVLAFFGLGAVLLRRRRLG